MKIVALAHRCCALLLLLLLRNSESSELPVPRWCRESGKTATESGLERKRGYEAPVHGKAVSTLLLSVGGRVGHRVCRNSGGKSDALANVSSGPRIAAFLSVDTGETAEFSTQSPMC